MKAEEIEAVLKLAGPQRYDYFIKRVADREQAWGLRDEGGWALAGDKDGKTLFPLWPAREYAERCAVLEWSGFAPAPIEVHSLIDELLPELLKAGLTPAVFYTPSQQGVVVSFEQLIEDLRHELAKME